MAPVVLLLLALGGILALGMARAPMWAWAAAVGLLTLIATHGKLRAADVDRVAAVRRAGIAVDPVAAPEPRS